MVFKEINEAIKNEGSMSWFAHALKGQCHAIWHLYKNLEGVFPSIEFQN